MCFVPVMFCWFFLRAHCAAQVAKIVSQQWILPNGESLLPSQWIDLELAKNKGLDNDGSGGRCLGWLCLAWVRCQNHKDMIHDMFIHDMFGGNRNGDDRGWASLSKVSLLTGAANFHGGLPVLKHSIVKLAKFLHSQHSDKLTSLQLPQRKQSLHFSRMDQICSKIETLDADSGIIALHNGVSIGHRRHAGCQRVSVAPFPSRRFHYFNRMDHVMPSFDLLDLMLKNFIQTLQMCGMESVFLLFDSFCVHWQMMATDTI